MRLFQPGNRDMSARHADIWAAYELAYTIVDFAAAGMFVVGSALFFFPADAVPATWLFLVGSLFFGLKPTIRLVRELRLLSLGAVDKVADEFHS